MIPLEGMEVEGWATVLEVSLELEEKELTLVEGLEVERWLTSACRVDGWNEQT